MRKLGRRQKVDLLLLQETKVANNIDCIIRFVWGGRSCGWDWVPLESASGGIIANWDDKGVCGEGVAKYWRILAVRVRNLADDFVWGVANVYGPNEEGERAPFLDSPFLEFYLSGLFIGT